MISFRTYWPGGAKWFMDYRNADGSLAEMCGNGTRAITLFAQREGVADSTELFRLGTQSRRQDSDATRQYEAVWDPTCFQVEMGSGRSAKPTP